RMARPFAAIECSRINLTRCLRRSRGQNCRHGGGVQTVHPPSKLVIHHVSPPRYVLTATPGSSDAGTAITWVQQFEDAAVVARLRHIVEPANEQNLDRLLTVLSGEHGRAG